MSRTLTVERSDLEKVLDTLHHAARHHIARDDMNAAIHISEPRYSPLTFEITSARDRVAGLLVEVITDD